jgi:hypothetical protein
MASCRFLPLGALAASLACSRGAFAQAELPSPVHAHSFDRDQGENPLRGSQLVFEQSFTTQTVGIGATPQSYVPLYELWLSLRPRYSFDEHWSLRGRFDYTKELTNNQATTLRSEDVFGDIWTDIVYGTKIDALWQGTKVDAGLRALWPTSKVSQGNGTYVTLGARAGATHEFDINGDGARAFSSAHVALRLVYLHPFSTATTPTDYGNFAYARQNVDGFSFASDQLQGHTLVNHELWTLVEGGVQITPRLSATAFMVLINQWHYPPSDSAKVLPSSNDQFTQTTWLVGSLEYELFDELELSAGYYNLANAIAPDGQARSVFGSDTIWWSPDARLFFAATANLDALYDDALGHRYTRRAAQSARLPGILGGLR